MIKLILTTLVALLTMNTAYGDSAKEEAHTTVIKCFYADNTTTYTTVDGRYSDTMITYDFKIKSLTGKVIKVHVPKSACEVYED